MSRLLRAGAVLAWLAIVAMAGLSVGEQWASGPQRTASDVEVAREMIALVGPRRDGFRAAHQRLGAELDAIERKIREAGG